MSLQSILQRSRASAPFRDAVADFLRAGRANELVEFGSYAPPVKVERTLTKLLEAYPEMAIERVSIQGSSGCEYFRGTLEVWTATQQVRVAFHWDCKWRALQAGWTDYFGFPDQARAAREFGHDCFRHWAEEGRVERAPEMPLATA